MDKAVLLKKYNELYDACWSTGPIKDKNDEKVMIICKLAILHEMIFPNQKNIWQSLLEQIEETF